MGTTTYNGKLRSRGGSDKASAGTVSMTASGFIADASLSAAPIQVVGGGQLTLPRNAVVINTRMVGVLSTGTIDVGSVATPDGVISGMDLSLVGGQPPTADFGVEPLVADTPLISTVNTAGTGSVAIMIQYTVVDSGV